MTQAHRTSIVTGVRALGLDEVSEAIALGGTSFLSPY